MFFSFFCYIRNNMKTFAQFCAGISSPFRIKMVDSTFCIYFQAKKGGKKPLPAACADRWGLPLSFREFVIWFKGTYNHSMVSHHGRETLGSFE